MWLKNLQSKIELIKYEIRRFVIKSIIIGDKSCYRIG